jgi:hypothetical protein
VSNLRKPQRCQPRIEFRRAQSRHPGFTPFGGEGRDRCENCGFVSRHEPEFPILNYINGLYRYIRHPIYAGEFQVLFAWPFEYGAPMTMLTMVVAGIFALRRRIQEDEVEMLAIYGDAYAGYVRETDAVIPNVW